MLYGDHKHRKRGKSQVQKESTFTPQPLVESDAVSWWSWRPGMRPLRAFLFGGLLSLLALFLLVNGAATLIAGILDSSAAPLRVPAVVTGQSKDVLGSPQLVLRPEQPGFPSTITLVVSHATAKALPRGSVVSIDYAPHQHTPYALENGEQRYALPGASASGNLWQTLALLLFGLLLLPYPSLLSFWGWRDLRTGRVYQRSAIVVALRTARQTTTRTPGLLPRTTNIWHGVALQMEYPSTPTPKILTFAIQQELHAQLQRGMRAEVTYSPALHHLYTLKVLHNSIK
jgi:hypothetical protein